MTLTSPTRRAGERSDFVRTAAWLASDQIVQAVLVGIVGIVVARRLGPAGLGDLSFALAVGAIVTPVVVSHRQLLVRDLVHEPEASGAILGTGMAFGGLAAVVAASCGVGFSFVAGGSTVRQVAIAVGMVGLFGVALGSAEAALQAQHRGRSLAVLRSGGALCGAILKLMLVLVGFGAVGFMAASSAQSVVLGVLAVLVVRRLVPARDWRVERIRLRRLVAESWPLAVSALAIAVYMTIDQVMLGLIGSKESVGIYAGAVRLSEATLLLPMAVMTSAAPLLTRLHRSDAARYAEQTTRVVRSFTTVSVTIAVLGAATAATAIRVLYGAAFADSAPILMVLLVANVFVYQGIATSAWVINEGLQRAYMVRTVVGAAINVALNLFLIPRWSGLGAAVATLVAYAYSGPLGMACARRSRPIALIMLRSLAPSSILYSLRNDVPALLHRQVVTSLPHEDAVAEAGMESLR